MSQYVSTHAAPTEEYLLLSPGNHPPRTGDLYNFMCYEADDVPAVLSAASLSDIVAVDFETKGNDYSTDLDIVGVGLAWSSGSCYLPYQLLPKHAQEHIITFLTTKEGLIAHNVYFDGGVLLKHAGKHGQWTACTYALLAHLANEGYPGAGWGLKRAQVTLLGWADSNEHDKDEWLVTNGYYIGNKRVRSDYEYLHAEYKSGGLKPDNGEMWRTPVEILGKYCILDAESCYLLYMEVLLPTMSQFPSLDAHFSDFMYLLRVLIDQKMAGIPVDRESLLLGREEISAEIVKYEQQFLAHPSVAPHVQELETEMRRELLDKEPIRLRKDGGVSKNWLKWKERLSQAEAGDLPEYRFNMQSTIQLSHLLYDRLGFEKRILTDKGVPAVSIKALKHMSDIGKVLTEYAWKKKELSYIDKYLELTETRPTIHPSFRSPGTVTGRLSSKEPNMQQIPKSKDMMDLFQARPGYVWIDLDFAALEPVVLTEFSQDENLMQIYGNGRPQNDVYLYVGAHIPGMDSKIRGCGYDPLNPTPEGLAAAKKQCKHERSICKTVVLACQYGAGVNKVMQTLENDDIFLDYQQVEEIHSGYWNLFAQVKDFSKSLWYQWRKNKGYVLNGVGRPMAVPEYMTKDILNRFVQSTGHDILVKYIRIYTQELDRLQIPWRPVIIDFHDASCIEVPESYKEQATTVMQWGVDQLNELLQGTIKLRGEPDVGYSLTDVKKPEE